MLDESLIKAHLIQRVAESSQKTKAVHNLLAGPTDKASPEFYRLLNGAIYESNQGLAEMTAFVEMAILIFGEEIAKEFIIPCLNANSAAAAGQPTGGSCGASPASAQATYQPTPTRESTSSQ